MFNHVRCIYLSMTIFLMRLMIKRYKIRIIPNECICLHIDSSCTGVRVHAVLQYCFEFAGTNFHIH